MLRFFARQKLCPTLREHLMRAELSAVSSNPIPVMAACKPSGFRAIQRNHKPHFVSEALGLAILDLQAAEVLALARDGGILLLEKDGRFASIPLPQAATIGPLNTDVFQHYKSAPPLRDLNGEGVAAQIQDTGYSPHPDIPADIVVVDCTGEGTTRDYHGHGTAIVSQMAAVGRFPGLIQNASIQMARIFDQNGQTQLSSILRAHAAALEKGVNVVSMSYGSPIPHPLIGWALRRLNAAGICLVAAAGNSGPRLGTVEFPGAYAEVIAVAALTKQGALAAFSSRGAPGHSPAKPDIAAEGVNIVMAASPDGEMGTPVAPGYVSASGTSFACPIGACLAAMILQAKGTSTPPSQVRDILQGSSSR